MTAIFQINYLVAAGEKVEILSSQAAVLVDVLICEKIQDAFRAKNPESLRVSATSSCPCGAYHARVSDRVTIATKTKILTRIPIF